MSTIRQYIRLVTVNDYPSAIPPAGLPILTPVAVADLKGCLENGKGNIPGVP